MRIRITAKTEGYNEQEAVEGSEFVYGKEESETGSTGVWRTMVVWVWAWVWGRGFWGGGRRPVDE